MKARLESPTAPRLCESNGDEETVMWGCLAPQFCKYRNDKRLLPQMLLAEVPELYFVAGHANLLRICNRRHFS